MEKKQYTAPEISIHAIGNVSPLCSSFGADVDSDDQIDIISASETSTDSKWSSTFNSINWGVD